MKIKPPSEIFEAYEHLGACTHLNLIDIGLINKTWLVQTADTKYILQEVSPIFDVSIHDDALAVCEHVKAQGLVVPAIIPERSGGLYVKFEGRIFRALSYINGQSFHKINNLKMAEQAGLIIGKFHRALCDFNYDYRSKRRQAGDFAFHAGNLRRALEEHSEHKYFRTVEPLAKVMLNSMTSLTNRHSTTPRHIHGDPKISNIMFDEHYSALALVDFDTLNKGGWALEMGDAFRSWCNPNQEDVLDAFVDLSIAEAALVGYGEIMKGRFSAQEHHELVINMQAITLCLAMRYLTDIFYEKYWAYDANRFARPADHHWLRAQAMFALYEDFARKRSKISELIKKYL